MKLYAYPVVFKHDPNGTVVARVPDVPGTITVGGDRSEALDRALGALLVMLSARMEDREPIPRPSRPARGQRVAMPSPIVSANLSVYETMRTLRISTAELAKRLGWDIPRLQRLLAVRQRSRLEDMEAALGALGKRLVIEIRNAA